MNKLKLIFKENWIAILFSYTLFTMQSIFMLSYPKVLGETMDHLIAKDYYYMYYLLLTFAGMMFFGYVSRIYDTRVFSKIYRRFASVETNKQYESDVDTTKINGRVNLMHNIIIFFERDMFMIMNTLYGIIVSMYFISLVDVTMVGYLVISGILTLGATYYYSPKLANITKLNNDLSEEQTEVISSRKISLVNNFLRRGQKLRIQLSNLDAKFSLWIQIIAYGTVTSLITYYVVSNNVTVGSAFSTYRYLFDFCIAIAAIPSIIESFINIKDVVKRLETEN